MVDEYDGLGALREVYAYGPGADEPIHWQHLPENSFRTLSMDERGSIVSLTDYFTGALTAINRYDEYGQPQASNVGAFGYTGQMWLPEIGAYNYKNRIYEPELGRFLQTDLIGYEGGPNLYAYVLNDPVNLIDPLGLIWCQVGWSAWGWCGGPDASLMEPQGISGGTGRGPSDTGGGAAGGGGSLSPPPQTKPKAKPEPPKCPKGPMATLNIGPSGTLFGGLFGVSGSLQFSVSVPWSSVSQLSLQGIQFGGTASITPLGGAGLYGSIGGWSAGTTSGPSSAGVASTMQTVFQAGAGSGGGVEVGAAGLGSSSNSVSGSGGAKASLGAYGAFGAQFSKSYSTRQFGCQG